MTTTVIDHCAVATIDADGTEFADGHVVVVDGVITAVGPSAVDAADDANHVDGRGCLATPGLVNTHHHLYQWLTRGLAADEPLFGWLTSLYPVWSRVDADAVKAAAAANLGWLALSGCTTSADHHYVFPADRGDLLAATVEAAGSVGVRLHACRGAMDLGATSGGLPPDDIVEDTDEALAACEAAVARHHDPARDARVRVAIAPCSPFSVTPTLLSESRDLAKRLGVRLHTHLAETLDEDVYCRERYGRSPVEYLDELGWLAPDVWVAHGVHLSDADVSRLAASGTGVAHCPSSNARLGAGVAPVRRLLDAGVPVGLGVDGAASHEGGDLAAELRQALYVARAQGGPTALSVRATLRMATMGGAQCLGRAGDIGSLEPGKLADVALWDLTGLGHAGIADPVAALVLASPPPLRLLMVGGVRVVVDGALVTADEDALAVAARDASARLVLDGHGERR